MSRKNQKLAALTAVALAMGMDMSKIQPESGEAVKEPKVCIICGKTNSSKKGECCSRQCSLVAKERAKETLVPNAAEAWDMEKVDLQKYERSLPIVERD